MHGHEAIGALNVAFEEHNWPLWVARTGSTKIVAKLLKTTERDCSTVAINERVERQLARAVIGDET